MAELARREAHVLAEAERELVRHAKSALSAFDDAVSEAKGAGIYDMQQAQEAMERHTLKTREIEKMADKRSQIIHSQLELLCRLYERMGQSESGAAIRVLYNEILSMIPGHSQVQSLLKLFRQRYETSRDAGTLLATINIFSDSCLLFAYYTRLSATRATGDASTANLSNEALFSDIVAHLETTELRVLADIANS